jgi:hypothetical protein
MSPKQHKWYLREWNKGFKTHWSGVKAGEVVSRPGRAANPHRDRVVDLARRMCVGAADGRLSPGKLRHACHLVALGRDKRSWDLTNKELDRVIAVFRLLGDPAQLAADMLMTRAQEETRRVAVGKAENPIGYHQPDADRKRMIWAMEHVDLPPNYVAELCRDKFGTTNWRSLPDQALHQLLVTCKCRAASRAIAESKKVTY